MSFINLSTIEFFEKIENLEIFLSCNTDNKVTASGKVSNINEEISDYIKNNKKEIISHIRDKDGGDLPLTSNKMRMYSIDANLGKSEHYNQIIAKRILGNLDIIKLSEAINKTLEKHTILETIFLEKNGSIIGVRKEVDRKNLLKELSIEEGKDQDDNLNKILIELKNQPFKLSEEIPIRFNIIKINEKEFVFSLIVHHIIFDGWSERVFWNDLTSFYNDLSRGRGVNKESLEDEYKQVYFDEQKYFHSNEFLEAASYWKDKLDKLPHCHRLPLDRPRKTKQEFCGKALKQFIDQNTTRILSDLAVTNHTTLFSVMYSAFALLLCRWSNEPEIVIGVPYAARNIETQKDLIGYFSNTLITRTQIRQGEIYREFLNRINNDGIDALEYQHYPFEKVIETLNHVRDEAIPPAFQISFTFQDVAGDNLSIDGAEVEQYEIDHEFSFVDLSLIIQPRNSGLEVKWIFQSELFEESSIKQLMECYETLVVNLNKSLEEETCNIPMLSGHQINLINSFNKRNQDGHQRAIHDIFSDKAKSHPDSIAVSYSNNSISFSELDRESNRVANYLKQKGCEKKQFVGICLNRGIESVIGILGILKAECAYVPIDINYPEERVKFILSDANIEFILTSKSVIDEIDVSDLTVILMDEPWRSMLMKNVSSDSVMDRSTHFSDRNPAYLMFTSGSTGTPKGVVIPHSGVTRLVVDNDFVELNEETVLLQAASLSFDASTFEIWGPLLNGGHVVLYPKDHIDFDILNETITKFSVNTIWLTAGLFNSWSHEFTSELGLKYILAGGDVIPPKAVERIYQACPIVRVINGYGPTENTTFTTSFSIPRTYDFSRPIKIGSNIKNCITYVLQPGNNTILPPGCIGELATGGPGLANEYLNDAELTESKFVNLTSIDGQVKRVYRTGDLVRMSEEGDYEYVGRIDNQVKIRGYRIEPNEIEALVLKLPAISKASILVVKKGEDKQLVLFVTLSEGSKIDETGLLAEMRNLLPEYLLPQHIKIREDLPINTNGKIDRQKLSLEKIEFQSLEEEVTRPQTEIEEIFHSIWCDVLQEDKICTRSNFYQLGGDSIKAIRIISLLKKQGYNLSVKDLINNPSIKESASIVKANDFECDEYAQFSLLKKEIFQPNELSKEDYIDAYPASALQAGMLYENLIHKKNMLYHDVFTYMVNKKFDQEKFISIWQELTNRHPMLRASFLFDDSDIYCLEHRRINFIDRYSHTNNDATNERLENHLNEEKDTGFDVIKPGLFRVKVWQNSVADNFSFSFSFHHSITDGWSVASIIGEFTRAYIGDKKYTSGILSGYGKFVSDELDAIKDTTNKDFWTNTLKGFDFEQKDFRILPQTQNEDIINTLRWKLDKQKISDLVCISHDQKLPLDVLFLAAYVRALTYYFGKDDVVCGLVVNNRPHIENTEQMFGLFLNTLPFRFDMSTLSGEKSEVFLKKIYEAKNALLKYQKYPYNQIKEDLQMEERLFQCAFNYTHFHSSENLLLENTLVEKQVHAEASLPMFFDVSRVGDDIELILTGHSTFIDTKMMEQFRDYLSASISDILNHNVIGQLLSEKNKADFEKWNKTSTTYNKANNFYSIFSDTATDNANDIAIICGDKQLTYLELEALVSKYAHILRHKEISEGHKVGISLPKSIELAATILAVWKLNAVCVPIDITYPIERKKHIISDSKVQTIITDKSANQELNGEYQLIVLEALNDAPPAATCEYEYVEKSGLAYIIYTSGSTGKPKGVMMDHSALVSRYYFYESNLELKSGVKNHLQMAGFGFDLYFGDFIRMLGSGGTMVIAQKEDILDSEVLYSLITNHSIHCLEFLPGVLRNLIDYLERLDKTLPTIKKLLVGSDSWNVTDHKRAQGIINTGAQLINCYGVTEAAIDSTYFTVEADEDFKNNVVPIGRAIDNVKLFCLNSFNQQSPIGVTGELCIGGEGLAEGYLGNEELTKSKFITYSEFNGEEHRLYRSGDMVRFLPDGNVEFLGRIDHQVKIRGYRVELDEINAAIQCQPSIKRVVTLAVGENENKYLVCFVCIYASEKELFSEASLLSSLENQLPHFMHPEKIITLDAIPMTPNGKTDVKALEGIYKELKPSHEIIKKPETELEILSYEIVKGISLEDCFCIESDFKSLGINSLKLLRLKSAFSSKHIEVSIRDLLENDSVYLISKLLEKRRNGFLNVSKGENIVKYDESNSQSKCILVPPYGGSLNIYESLIKSLESKYCFYGLIAPCFANGDEIHKINSLEDLASYYAEIIFENFQNQKITLFGFSLGGVICPLIAHKLKEQNITIQSILMLDSYLSNGDAYQGKPDSKSSFINRANFLFNLNVTENNIDDDRWSESSALSSLSKEIDDIFDEKELIRYWEFHKDIDQAEIHIQSVNLSCDITLIVNANYHEKESNISRWRGFIGSGLKTNEICYNHDEFLSNNAIANILKLI